MRDKILVLINSILIFIYIIIIILSISMTLLRYFFNMSLYAAFEFSRYLFIYTTCLGIGLLIARKENIKVDFFLKKLQNRSIIKKLIVTIHYLIIAILHIYLIFLSIDWISKTGNFVPATLKIPIRYVQIGFPIGFTLVIFYSLNNIYNIITDKDEG